MTTGAASEPVKTVLSAVNSYEVLDNYVGRICVETDFKDIELFVNGDMRESRHLVPHCIVRTDVLNLSGTPFTVPEGSVVTRAHKCSGEKIRKSEINYILVTRNE